MLERITRNDKILHWTMVGLGALITANYTLTGNIILLAPFLLLGLWWWTRFAVKHPAAALVVVIFFAEHCFDMFTFGLRQRFLSDLAILLMLLLIALNLRKVWHHLSIQRTPYPLSILLFFFALLISLYWGSHLTFGQPMGIGLTVARKHLLFLSYFFLAATGATREDCFLFLKYLAWLGAGIAFLSLVEVLLGGGVIFSHYYAVGQERAGLLRIHVGTFLVVFSLIYSLVKLQYTPSGTRQRLFYTILIGINLFTLIFVVITRAVILGLLVTLLLWLIRKISNKKIIFICSTVSLFATIILTGLGETMVSETFIGEILGQTTTEMSSDTGNISIRKKGAQFYLKLIQDTAPLTGIGIFSFTNYPNNPVTMAADRFSYYLVDTNGITTLVYFGLQGLLLLIFFVYKSLKDANRLMKNNEDPLKYNYEILFYVFIYILVTPTLGNIIVERMLIYSGMFFYLLSSSAKNYVIVRKAI
ncbi:MAG: hypothetical protein OEY01_05185 [Desulfobulbaceae bacterium]|nr:hypothetical protein [Desulfobulbaceae bacterium]